MKRFIVLLMVLCMVSISQAEMIADFETGTDNFVGNANVTVSQDTTAGTATSGTHSLKIQCSALNYWGVQWNAPSIPTKLGVLQFDLTMFAAEWPKQNWTNFAQAIAINSNGPSGWKEYGDTTQTWVHRLTGASTNSQWGAYDGDCFKTCTVDLSNYNFTGATYFQIIFSTNLNAGTGLPLGPFYIDNVHFLDLPNTPAPANNGIGIVGATTQLSWTNALPDLEYDQVWFGEAVGLPTDPNYPSLANYKTKLNLISKITSPGATSTAAIPAIVEGKRYAWVVDGFKGCGDPNASTEPNYPGVLWTFLATTNNPPTANAGTDKFVYTYTDLNNITITLNGSATDDGKISPLTYAWTMTAGPAATINSPNSATTTVTLTGGLASTTEDDGGAVPYVFHLVANDGQFTGEDDITVHVNTNACRASVEAGGNYFYGDIAGPAGAGPANRDCKVDLYDFAELAINWLNCMDTFTACP